MIFSNPICNRSCLSVCGSVGEGNDHLQLIRFWPSCAPGKGVCGGAKNFGSTLLQPAHSVCISLSTLSFKLAFSPHRLCCAVGNLLPICRDANF